jgi:hypothetical protein
MRGRGTNRRAAWIAAGCTLAAALALGLSACGGDSGQASAEAKDATTARSETQPAAQKEKDPAPAAETCAGQVGGFIDSMATLRSDLVAGLSYEDYVAEVESIRGAYHRVPVGKLALGCLRAAGTPGESGLNKYIEASNAWTECVEAPGCESATVEPALQSRWRQASKLLGEAQAGLKELEKPSGSS